MFGTKPQADPESDSDWDSIPGDIPEATSSQEPTPRYQPAPAPPAMTSPRNQGPSKRVPAKPQTASGTPERTSALSTPSTQDRKLGTAPPASQRPSQIYGKPGVTSFNDRSPGITTFVDRSLSSNQREQQLTPDVNANRISSSGAQGRREQLAIDIEMNEVDFQPSNPPFTDFKGALTEQDVSRPDRNERSKKVRPKSPYSHVTKTPIPPEDSDGNNSWDESAREEPMSHSRQQLTETPREHRSKKKKSAKRMTAVAENEAIQQSCCVPLEGDRQIKEYLYYFHHGHNDHLASSPEWKEVYMKNIADRSEKWLQYFWQEFFSVLRIILDFAFIFFLELFRFIVRYVLLRLLAGVVMVVGDHLLKPYLAVLFNSFIQPLFVFTWNVLSALNNVLRPLLDILRQILQQLAALLRAFRLFELIWKPSYETEQRHDIRVM